MAAVHHDGHVDPDPEETRPNMGRVGLLLCRAGKRFDVDTAAFDSPLKMLNNGTDICLSTC